MRLRDCDHAEALALARRLQRSEPGTAADDRRALLLFWYGSGATRLRAEEDVLIAAWTRHGGADHPLARLGAVVADDATAELLLLVGGQQGALVDLLEVELQTRLDGG